MKWLSEEERVLTEMANAGFTVNTISKVLKSRSRDAIEQKAAHLNLSLAGKPPEIDYEVFKKLIASEEPKCV
jgi:hypothetical protein